MDGGHVPTVVTPSSSVGIKLFAGVSICRMRAIRRSMAALTASVVILATSACSSERAECVSHDVGEVCAEVNDGAINFHGDGLLPGSEVVVQETVVGPMVYPVGDDGSFDLGNSQGLMSVFADTEFTFEVFAVDADGNPLTGQIEISTG